MQDIYSNFSFFLSVIDIEFDEIATSFSVFQDIYWRNDLSICRYNTQSSSYLCLCLCFFGKLSGMTSVTE